jgi:hypothetical protein
VQVGHALIGAKLRTGLVERAKRGPAVHVAKRCSRKDQVACLATGAHRGQHREDGRPRVRLVRAEVEGRTDEDVPEAVDRRLALAVPAQEVAEGLATWRKPRQPGDEGGDANAIPEREVPITEERRKAVPDGRHPSALVEHLQVERHTHR